MQPLAYGEAVSLEDKAHCTNNQYDAAVITHGKIKDNSRLKAHLTATKGVTDSC